MEAALHFKPAARTPVKTTKALDDDMDDVEVGSLPVGVEACLAVRRRNDDDRRQVEQLSRQLDAKGKEVNEYDFEIQSPMPPRAGRRRKSDSGKAAPANGVGFPPAGSATPGWLAKAESALEAVLAEDAQPASVSRSHSVASLVDAIEVERQTDVEVALVDTIAAELALSDRSAGQDGGSNDASRAEHEQQRREAARGGWGGWRLFSRSPTSFERFGEQPQAVDEAAADGEQRQQPMEPPEGGQLDGAPPLQRAPTWVPPLMAKEGGDAPRARPGAWLRDLFAQLEGRALLLVALLLFQSASSVILRRYESLLGRHPTLIAFLTMLVGAGGNAGNQAAVLVIRGLATGATRRASMGRLLLSELRVGLCIAALLAALSYWRVDYFLPDDAPHAHLESATVATSAFCIVAIAVVVGAALPMGLYLVRLDPAHAGATIQVVMDIVGVLITCFVGSRLLSSHADEVAAQGGRAGGRLLGLSHGAAAPGALPFDLAEPAPPCSYAPQGEEAEAAFEAAVAREAQRRAVALIAALAQQR